MDPEEIIETSPIDIVGKSIRNAYFDEVIGHIEDIVLSDEFMSIHQEFLEKHCQIFEETEENRLEYMEIYLKYVNIFECYLSEQLHRRMEDFNMQRFAEELSNVADMANNDDGDFDEIFELLQSFHNFQVFKDLMLDYRKSHDRKLQSMDLDTILLTKPMHINQEE